MNCGAKAAGRENPEPELNREKRAKEKAALAEAAAKATEAASHSDVVHNEAAANGNHGADYSAPPPPVRGYNPPAVEPSDEAADRCLAVLRGWMAAGIISEEQVIVSFDTPLSAGYAWMPVAGSNAILNANIDGEDRAFFVTSVGPYRLTLVDVNGAANTHEFQYVQEPVVAGE